jgi:hypothetical protein
MITGVEDVAATIAAVKSQPADSVVAVVGHSNTIGPIIDGLGGGIVEEIGANEFDKLFVVFIAPVGTATLLRLRYGAIT